MYFELEDRTVSGWAPTVDVCERAGEFVILVELPGVERSDVRLAWKEKCLVISGQKKRQPVPGAVAQYLCVERTYGPFRREIDIHIPVDHTRAYARLEDGLLRIHVPKSTVQAEEVVIPVL